MCRNEITIVTRRNEFLHSLDDCLLHINSLLYEPNIIIIIIITNRNNISPYFYVISFFEMEDFTVRMLFTTVHAQSKPDLQSMRQIYLLAATTENRSVLGQDIIFENCRILFRSPTIRTVYGQIVYIKRITIIQNVYR